MRCAALLLVPGVGPRAHQWWISAREEAPGISRPTVRLLVVFSDGAEGDRSASLRRGTEFGVEEAARTLALFDMSLTASSVSARDVVSAEQAVDNAPRGREPPSAVVLALSGLSCLTWRMPPPLPTLDAGWYRDDAKACDSDGSPPRRAIAADRQHGVLLRVRPSAATVATIATAHSAIAPGVEWTRPAAATRRVELWHPSLERFGAEQLNQRYERRYGRPMDSDAWAGWIAVKILAESALRAHATTSGALQRALTDPRAQFDGHKGRPLVFDARTGELRQPLYTVDAAGDRAPSRVSAEVFPDAWR